MTNSFPQIAQLFLRIALAAGFFSPVADRFGLWGKPGTPDVAWGDWQHFSEYAHQLMFFLPAGLAGIFAIIATAAEIIFGVMLLIGLATRWAALGSGLLVLGFGASMIVALGVHSPLNYSVFAVCAGSFLLATVPSYRWSIDSQRTPAAG